MKKAIKWTAYILLLAAVITTVVCYLVFPAETKRAIDKIMQYANTPIAIAGVTTTVGGVLGFVISKYVLDNTKFGRRELDTIHETVNEFKDQSSKAIQEYKGKFEELKSNYEGKFEDLKSETEGKITVVYNEFKDLQDTLLGSLEAFPNKHIQALVAEYKARFQEREAEIVEKTINTNEFIDKKIAEIKAQYETMFNELLGKVEKTLNEEAADD